MSQAIGKETILECKVSASPHGYVTWKRNGTTLQYKLFKYRRDIYETKGSTEKTLALTIIDLEKHDFGLYTCEATNQLGSDSESMVLYGKRAIKFYKTPFYESLKHWHHYVC